MHLTREPLSLTPKCHNSQNQDETNIKTEFYEQSNLRNDIHITFCDNFESLPCTTIYKLDENRYQKRIQPPFNLMKQHPYCIKCKFEPHPFVGTTVSYLQPN